VYIRRSSLKVAACLRINTQLNWMLPDDDDDDDDDDDNSNNNNLFDLNSYTF
jgi:hypothetical protein